MALALDEPKDTDENLDAAGFNFVIDKELNGKGSPFKVDLSYSGFVITSAMEMGGGSECGSCSGSCG